MPARSALFLLFAANILIPIAILVFAQGFFPYKPFLSGLAEYDSPQDGLSFQAPFDRVVFMVVDALRSDFVYSEPSGFTFTQGLISSGSAIPFTAYATSPTITMPRIKAITTGSTPSFLDLILNFAESDTSSSLATQDTWLAQMKAKNTGKMVMYGDDTWLKLFPNTFDRSEGTSSFFVSDFTEVDNNVTRHLPGELDRNDWNTMILHYLGLDHIGHKAGPQSPNMIPKQKEMDGIVQQIYEAMTTRPHLKSTLLVLLGDHGMNDAGNHGGSAPGETSPALVFISPALKNISSGLESPAVHMDNFRYYDNVAQSDIAPTLGALLGFPVPKNNLGVLIPRFLDLWERENDKLKLTLRNANQILNVVKATFPSFKHSVPSGHCQDPLSDIDNLSCRWHTLQSESGEFNSEDAKRRIGDLYLWSKHAQGIMSSTASNYDIVKLSTGQAVAALALSLGLGAAWRICATPSTATSCSFLGISLLYGVMTFASSYVEEEQHFWYWTATGWLILVWIKGYRKQWLNPQFLTIAYVTILIVMRLSRRWNQTGQKFAGSPDIARSFLLQHTTFLWTLVGITYLWNLNSLISVTFAPFGQRMAKISGSALITAAVTFKLAFTNEDSPELLSNITRSMAGTELGVSLVARARIVFVSLAASVLLAVILGFRKFQGPNPTMYSLHDLLTIFLITQSRVTNIPLLLMFSIQRFFLADLGLSTLEITTTSILLQHASFFAFGNSNAISSIDLSNAYNGVSGYNVLAVGVLTFVSNWTGPIFWTSATTLMLLEQSRRGEQEVLRKHLSMLTVFSAVSLLFVMVTCTFLRTHLFIWTVFSPKFLYAMAWSLGQHLCMNMGVGSLLYWLGTRYQELQAESGYTESGMKHPELRS